MKPIEEYNKENELMFKQLKRIEDKMVVLRDRINDNLNEIYKITYVKDEAIMSTILYICRELGVTLEELRQKNREGAIKDGRHAIAYVLREVYGKGIPLQKIATILNLAKHETVLNGIKRMKEYISNEKDTAKQIELFITEAKKIKESK